MAKNILVFSDGTGQRSGISSEERQTNVFKIYKSVRCGPDSIISPREQLSFYDPGIGTVPEGVGYTEGFLRKIYNVISQATGYGITLNTIDCYSQIIQMWRPGDRIFLIGFSRGAYTVRCLAAALVLCGVPTRLGDGKSMLYDSKTARKLAKEAIKKVYQHVNSPKDEKFLSQRALLASEFRKKYGSAEADGSNGAPYFIGVFDTVAALMNTSTMLLSVGLIFLAILLISAAINSFVNLAFKDIAICIFTCTFVVIFILFFLNNLKFAWGLPGYGGLNFFKTVHWRPTRIKFYDNNLNPNIQFARHAIAIDEHRESFDRVPWGNVDDQKVNQPGQPVWLKQVWFAGNHSDVGGSYSENESGLSNISLKWMVDEMKSLPNAPKFNESVLNIFPNSSDIQHDELKSSAVFRVLSRFTPKFYRSIKSKAKLHQSVLERFKQGDVIQFDERKKYRPQNLKDHELLTEYYL